MIIRPVHLRKSASVISRSRSCSSRLQVVQPSMGLSKVCHRAAHQFLMRLQAATSQELLAADLLSCITATIPGSGDSSQVALWAGSSMLMTCLCFQSLRQSDSLSYDNTASRTVISSMRALLGWWVWKRPGQARPGQALSAHRPCCCCSCWAR